MTDRSSPDRTPDFDSQMMRICLDLARKASLEGEVPVGALVVSEGVILSQGHNLTYQRHDPTAHAECLVLREAGRVRQTAHLDGCTLYATLEPCPMCAGALVQSRVDRLVYGADDLKAGGCHSLYRLTNDLRLNHQVRLTRGVLAKPCAALMTEFFRSRR